MKRLSATNAAIGTARPPGILNVPVLSTFFLNLNFIVASTTPAYNRSKDADTITANCLNPPDTATKKAIAEKVMIALAGVANRG